jgi:hypothetical protein
MRRLLIACAIVLPLVALGAVPAQAEVKTRSKDQIKFEGMLGRMMGMVGGKAMKEGLVSTAAVKGNRKATMNETSGQIIDLSEEKIYNVDFKKKTYEVTTFDELRRRMREAQERAQKDAQKEQGKAEPQQPQKELEVDFNVKETGQKKPIAGYDAHEVIITIAVREKGKTLEEGGGLVMTADSWLGPQIPALKELSDFDQRYWKQLEGPEAAGMSAEQMAAALALYPMMKPAMERLQKESSKLQGTPLATTTTFEGVKSKAQMASAAESGGSGGGGIGGMLARKMIKKDEPKQRSTIVTLDHETQEISTSVTPADIELPAGFKEKK